MSAQQNSCAWLEVHWDFDSLGRGVLHRNRHYRLSDPGQPGISLGEVVWMYGLFSLDVGIFLHTTWSQRPRQDKDTSKTQNSSVSCRPYTAGLKVAFYITLAFLCFDWDLSCDVRCGVPHLWHQKFWNLKHFGFEVSGLEVLPAVVTVPLLWRDTMTKATLTKESI